MMMLLGPRQHVKLPLGLKDSGAIFQKAIHQALAVCPGVIPYIDDILVSGQSKKEHDRNLEFALRKLHAKNLWLNLLKCLFHKAEVPFLGRILSGTELRPAPKMLDAISDAPAPTNVKELCSFLGLINYCSIFIPDLATPAEPLRALDRDENAFILDENVRMHSLS